MIGTRISTNTEEVKGRLMRLEAEMHKAFLRALEVDYWRPVLKRRAYVVLNREWAKESDEGRRRFYQTLSHQIVGTVVGMLFDSGAWFVAAVPDAAVDASALWPDLARAAQFNAMTQPTGKPGRPTDLARGLAGAPELLYPEEHGNLERVRQTIRDWCALEKHLKADRDYNADGTVKTPEQIAERIMEILGVGKEVKARTAVMEQEAKELFAAINDWLAGNGATSPEMARAVNNADAVQGGKPPPPRLDPDSAREWLERVLGDWVETTRKLLPGRVQKELGGVRQMMAKGR
ncbi:MAG TPA: hypothetical protein VMU04_10190 [Candidatus Acidoferrum sp.]|nr:hypothetical protein [Candidatus Acidoferrum sp.]